MCTAISFNSVDHYFGRNLDLYYSYNEKIIVTPQKFPFDFRMEGEIKNHYAFIGMATLSDNFPLYYDGVNEAGLGIAALNFPENACYSGFKKGKINLAPFELIPWVLSKFSSVKQAAEELKKLNLVDVDFSSELLNSPLHWLISDKHQSIVVEPVAEGVKIYENPIGVLTNNPPFETQMLLLQNYSSLSAKYPEKSFSPLIKPKPYSLGMGAMGLPGDPSSPSRFVRAAFTKLNSPRCENELASVGQFFHILGSTEQQKGVSATKDGRLEYTLYSCCINTNKGIYYYTTYGNRSITAVNMQKEKLCSECLITFDLQKDERIHLQN